MPPKKLSSLPTKERTLFGRLIQEYESKKHKQGLKTADAILKKFPDHGETLCMKGLLLASVNRREEGIELAKKGVRFDLTSFICWHALGILNRMDKNYEEAIKCYGQALRIEGGGNLNLLRESAFMHLQLRDYPPLVDKRLTLLKMQPHVRSNWVGLAVAHHLAGNHEEAARVLTGYQDVMRDIPKRNYEHSEILLYHASILQEMNEHVKAEQFLEANKARILDTKAYSEILAQSLAKQGKVEEAEKIWRGLIDRNPECKAYFVGLLSVRGIDLESRSDPGKSDEALALFAEIQEKHPRSTAAKRLSLVFARGEEFHKLASAYLRNGLTKGIPSIYSDLKSLYQDDAKREAIEVIAESLRSEWSPKVEEGTDATDPPSSYMWCLYYLAQHYSQQPGKVERALQYINSAISHSPTQPELHMIKARVLKRGGDLQGASFAMSDARLLDGQDRYLNSKAAKYLLRIDEVEEAVKTVGLFTKPDAPDPVSDLNEMQALWYLVEEAESHVRKGETGLALKRLHQVDRVFQEVYDDQLDFHSYCLRKMTMRAYVSTIRFEDDLRSHPQYLRAALDLIRIHLDLFDRPSSSVDGEGDKGGKNGEAAALSEEEKKKLAKKAKKAELRAAAASATGGDKKKSNAADAKASGNNDEEEVPPPLEDKDPMGEELLKKTEADPLGEAEKFLGVLMRMAGRRVETWTAAFEVWYRRNNWVGCLSALNRVKALSADHPDLNEMIVRIKRVDLSNLSQPAKSVVEKGLKGLVEPEEKSLEVVAVEGMQRSPASAEHVLGSAKALFTLRGAEAKRDVLELVLGLTREEVGCSLKTLIKAREFLKNKVKAAEEEIQRFDQEGSKVFPLADVFKRHEELKEYRRVKLEERDGWNVGREEEQE